MGCDIHAYVVWNSTYPGRDDIWRSLSDDELDLGRDYWLFSHLAGVRGDRAVFEPRGLLDMGGVRYWPYGITEDYGMYVDDEYYERHPERYVSKKTAEEYVSRGRSAYYATRDNPIGYVSNPNWHTPSWLYLDELEKVISTAINASKGLGESEWTPPTGLVGTFGAMTAINHGMGTQKPDPYRSVLVFWFDN